jgi:hypothetical protein
MKKFLKYLAIGLFGLVAILLALALFVKKEYTVERSININQPRQVVFDYVKFLKNQDNYSVWSKIDPNMKKEFRGTDGTVGFVSAWDSPVKEAGRGEQEIVKITDVERIDFVIRFFEPIASTDNAYMALKSNSETNTNITWGFNGKYKYPMNLMLLFMDMDAMLGKDLEGGLKNLKTELEK